MAYFWFVGVAIDYGVCRGAIDVLDAQSVVRGEVGFVLGKGDAKTSILPGFACEIGAKAGNALESFQTHHILKLV